MLKLKPSVSSDLNDRQLLHSAFGNLWKTPIDTSPELQFLDNFQTNLKFIDNRHQVKLPFRKEFDAIDYNFNTSKQTLRALAKRFNANPKLYEAYKVVLDNQHDKGIIESKENVPLPGRLHYLNYLLHFMLIILLVVVIHLLMLRLFYEM